MQKNSTEQINRIDLGGPWQLTWTEQPVAGATTRAEAERGGLVFHGCDVPGNIELDLFKLGELPEPFFGMNPVEVARATEKLHVYYSRTFAAPAATDAEARLVFEGLDCFTDVYVNGELVLQANNMLVEQTADVTELVREGANELFVHIRPALLEALKYDYPQFINSLDVNTESVYIRKAPHMYGWDIMPRFLSAGMYRPVYLELLPEERIEELYLKTIDIAPDHASARLQLYYRFKARLNGQYAVRIRMACGDSALEQTTRAHFISGKLMLELGSPRLWWPKGRGEASLYDVQVELLKDGQIIDCRRFAHGVRTVELVRTSVTTSTGEGEFVFLVNGEKVFAKGSNWVPVDAFHSRDHERIPAILDMVNDLNCNMLRCWGGNVYEDDLFYDLCDRSGILVWQDFSMACSMYPQDDAFAARLAEEVATVIKRLRGHASVALWSGDNECDWSYLWGHTHIDPNTNRLTRKVIPEVLRIHDGARPYIASSPFFDEGTLGKGVEYLTETHLWGPRDYFKSAYYTSSLCHFVSEIGYHGCPSPRSIGKFISRDKLWPCLGNEEWLLHCTSPVPSAHSYDYRVELMRNQIAEFFTDIPDNLEDFAFASQSVQAEAKKFFIELFRIAKWRRTGILWWNIVDGWPQFSDAVVDYYFEKKLAYHTIRRSQQDVCVMLGEPDSWVQKVIASNDTRVDRQIRCSVRDIDSGETVFSGQYTAHADRATVLGQIPYVRNRQRFFVITWEGDTCGANHYVAGQPPFDLKQYRSWMERSGLYGEYFAQ